MCSAGSGDLRERRVCFFLARIVRVLAIEAGKDKFIRTVARTCLEPAYSKDVNTTNSRDKWTIHSMDVSSARL